MNARCILEAETAREWIARHRPPDTIMNPNESGWERVRYTPGIYTVRRGRDGMFLGYLERQGEGWIGCPRHINNLVRSFNTSLEARNYLATVFRDDPPIA